MPGLLTHWTRKDIPDQSGKVAVVTGGNSGIGFEVCRQLMERNAAVVMVVRNKELGEQAVEDLKEEFPGCKVSIPGSSGTVKEPTSALSIQCQECMAAALAGYG